MNTVTSREAFKDGGFSVDVCEDQSVYLGNVCKKSIGALSFELHDALGLTC